MVAARTQGLIAAARTADRFRRVLIVGLLAALAAAPVTALATPVLKAGVQEVVMAASAKKVVATQVPKHAQKARVKATQVPKLAKRAGKVPATQVPARAR